MLIRASCVVACFLGFVFNRLFVIVTSVITHCVSANSTVYRHLSVLFCAGIHILTSNMSTRNPRWENASYRAVFAAGALAEGTTIYSTRNTRQLSVRWAVSLIDLGKSRAFLRCWILERCWTD